MSGKPRLPTKPYHLGTKSITYRRGPSYEVVAEAFVTGEPVEVTLMSGVKVRIRVTGLHLLSRREYCFEGMYLHPDAAVLDLRHRVECHTSLEGEEGNCSGTYFPHPSLPSYG